MANAFKSVFGAKVDRFLVGKLVFGILAILSLLASATSFIRAAMGSWGTIEMTGPVSSLVRDGIWSAVVAVVWIAAFYWVARQEAAGGNVETSQRVVDVLLGARRRATP